MSNDNQSMGDLFPDLGPEDPVVSGIAHDRSEAQVTLRRIPDRPGVCASIFTQLADAGVNVDMIVQAAASTGTADVSFTTSESQIRDVENILEAKREELGYESVDFNTSVGKVALVGVGMKTHSGIAATFFRALSEKNINVLMISTSEIRISAMVPLEDLDDAVRAIHTKFNLDADQVEAVVYGGTGR
ncbi:ACT domain-containing protein [Bifidobacterium callimiconis]|uniref:aspartate kinase n=1 Tax=Bifidobacterium callimiconis TaxID=2306973 RepID=A0A430FBV6_9BIFI|nr:ACT domain-containing protein [Bifidobacterium callimiconis]MBT1177646.1 ACT domain-containing protein [Bifidobacterium callimiconis]RSX50319.1 aspartate kinase [Bifidobacterium callimiconis]